MVFNPDLSVDVTTMDGRLKLWGLVEVLLIAVGILNSINESLMAFLTEFSIGIHLIGTVVIFIYLLAAAPTRQPASFVFTQFIDYTGWDNLGFAILLGFLMPAWTYLGHDSSAHLSEETQNSHTEAAKGILLSVGISAIAGFILLLGMLFSIQDIDSILTTSYPQPIVQLVYDATGKTGTGVIMVGSLPSSPQSLPHHQT